MAKSLLDDEIEQVLLQEIAEDRFTNMPQQFASFPALKAELDELAEVYGLELPTQNTPRRRGAYTYMTASVDLGSFELQRHTVSVDEHTDDVRKGAYFGLYVLDTKPVSRDSLRIYDTSSEFRYFDIKGAKQRTRLKEGDFCAFNPRRNHELIYYGELVTVMLFELLRKKL